jgi:hypothetical protein
MASGRAQRAAANREAKERRQKIIAAVGVVILLLLLVLELPKMLDRVKGSSSGPSTAPAAAPAAPPATAEAAAASALKAYRAVLKQPPHDVFTQRKIVGPSTLGSVATPPGLHDPFAKPNTQQAAAAPPAQSPVAASPLPGTIVIGTPGANKITQQGWILILASIPTAQGRAAAAAFASRAGGAGIGDVSLLNSSNRRPLRGGYWVVYTGPYNTLAEVSAAANHVHSSGFATAYIRQLVVYKAKPAPAKHAKPKTKKKK